MIMYIKFFRKTLLHMVDNKSYLYVIQRLHYIFLKKIYLKSVSSLLYELKNIIEPFNLHVCVKPLKQIS
jgi:hypothetical protein